MSEVKIIYSLEWCVQSVSVVGYSPEYVMLCCVAGALFDIQSNLSQYLISVLIISLKTSEVPEIQKLNCCVTPLDLSEISVKIRVSQDVILCC